MCALAPRPSPRDSTSPLARVRSRSLAPHPVRCAAAGLAAAQASDTCHLVRRNLARRGPAQATHGPLKEEGSRRNAHAHVVAVRIVTPYVKPAGLQARAPALHELGRPRKQARRQGGRGKERSRSSLGQLSRAAKLKERAPAASARRPKACPALCGPGRTL